MASGFVDAHLHCWDRTLLRYPWLDADERAPIRFTPTDLPVPARPRAAVFVEAGAAPGDGAREARWASEHAGGAIAAIVAHAPVHRGDRVEETLEALLAIPMVVGVREVLQDEPDERLSDPAWSAGLDAVADRGLLFDACVRDRQLGALADLVRSAPGTTVVLDHLGKPPLVAGWGSDRASAWARSIRVLAHEPNVVVKLSGLIPEAGPGPLEDQARPFVEAALEAFGPARAMAGSDWPVSRVPGRAEEYRDWFDLLGERFGLDDDEREQVLLTTARRVYRIQTTDLDRRPGD